jgi:hypothetical protein
VALGYDLETEFFPIDQSLTKYDVKGYKNPVGDYVQTAVYKAVKFGGFMAIDEGDMWAAAALGSLNSILANDYGVFGDELVKVHPKFRCALAANTFGFGATAKFIGRNPLDKQVSTVSPTSHVTTMRTWNASYMVTPRGQPMSIRVRRL